MSDADITLAELGVKMENLTDQVKSMSKRVSSQSGRITKMGNKVHNGFGEAISAVKEQADFNTKTISRIVWFGATSAIMIFLALLGIFVNIWLHDKEMPEPVPMEVESNVLDDS